jgi:hypothetical protein
MSRDQGAIALLTFRSDSGKNKNMARTEIQRESFRQLEWALSFCERYHEGIANDQLRRLNEELRIFVQTAQAVGGEFVPSFLPSRGTFPRLQAGIKKHFKDLASVSGEGQTENDKSAASATSFRVDGAIDILATYGKPYRQNIRAGGQENKVYAALASHLLASGIIAGQIRNCPECGNVFLLQIKPHPNREFHCSSQCTNRATFRRYVAKQRHESGQNVKFPRRRPHE